MYSLFRGLRLRAFLLVTFFLGISWSALSATLYTRAAGGWSFSNNGPSCGCTPGKDDVLFINHNATITGDFVVDKGVWTVAAGVTMTVTGNLTFNNNSIVTIDGNLFISGDFKNKNNSDDVDFNGNVTIKGTFTNENNGVIDFGPNATITAEKGCTNSGTVTQNGTNYFDCTSGPLPVKVMFFHAEQIGTEIQLTWATASEKNFQYFAIERADAELNWEQVGTVEGSGTSQTRIDYAYTDKYPGLVGILYYRLKAVDFDGYTEYFQVVSVNYRATKAWYISPNPVQDGEVVLMRNFAEDEEVMATLYSMSGSEILTEQISVTTDRYVITSSLNPGLYILKLKDSNGTKNLRFAVE
ncbi:MAG: T9SS type A sorting domain-containing protein [Chryseolinea sp.]